MSTLFTVALTALTVAPTPAFNPSTVLPERWQMGDWATPVEWQGETLYLYADPVTVDGQIARSLVVHNDTEFIHPIAPPGQESFYWLTDGVELPDGRLLVAAVEVTTPEQRNNDGWDFVVEDTDMFVVTNPLDAESWRIASAFAPNRYETGWWNDADQIEFSDQHPGLAFAHNSYCAVFGDCRTVIYEYDPANPAVGRRVGRLPFESDGQVAPIQTGDGWIAVSWDWETNTSTMWAATDLLGEWVEGDTVVYTGGATHAHGLNVIDGQVWHRYSVIGERPVFELVEV